MRDHDHLNGKFRGAAHQDCNINANLKNYKFPVIAHNSKNYDNHFLFQELGKINRKIDVIALTNEKYLSFTSDKIKFLDSFQFTLSSLEAMISGMKKENNINLFKNFNEGFKNFNEKTKELLLQKGIFPYDYYNNENVLNGSLPSIDFFYNKLNDLNISKEEYEHAKNVYIKTSCKSFRDYLEIYLKCEVLLLADCFENYRNIAFKN